MPLHDAYKFQTLNRVLRTDLWIPVAIVWVALALTCTTAGVASGTEAVPEIDGTPVSVTRISHEAGYAVRRAYAGTVVHRLALVRLRGKQGPRLGSEGPMG